VAFTVLRLISIDGAETHALRGGNWPVRVRCRSAAGGSRGGFVGPVRDAVVTLYPAGSAARAARPGGRFVVSQKNVQFHPFLTIVPVGADVSFPNLDPTKHHVYSFSPAKRFELKLFAKDQSRTPSISTSPAWWRSAAISMTR
jgi:hypothetical protein